MSEASDDDEYSQDELDVEFITAMKMMLGMKYEEARAEAIREVAEFKKDATK